MLGALMARPVNDAARALRELERLRDRFGDGAARAKLDGLRRLDRARFTRAPQLVRLHEALLFLVAFPDDERVRRAAGRMLDRFAARADLDRLRDTLADSGIAGTEIWFCFFEPTARWLAERWPDLITIDWHSFEHHERLATFLPSLTTPSEQPAIDELPWSGREWIEALKSPRETDAAFLSRRFTSVIADGVLREKLWDELNAPFLIRGDRRGPSRTMARDPRTRIVHQAAPPSRGRPNLERAMMQTPTVRPVTTSEGRRYIDLARVSMITRARDLDAFSWADPRDVRLIDFGDALQFACMGQVPERRLMFESVYGFLTLRNGVPTGYVLTASLFGSAEIAYNVFETFRGAEAAQVYGRVLAMTRYLFGADTFMVPPYQLGDGNEEAQQSGAWWFYQKLGFRPRDAATRRLMNRELARMRERPAHRSSIATLATLAETPMYWSAGAPRADVMGRLPLGALGLAATRLLAKRFGSARTAGAVALAEEAARRAGVRSMRGWSRAERDAWTRWAPIVVSLPGLPRWTPAERRALVRVVRLKGGKRESDYVRAFDSHLKLKRGLLALAKPHGR
jgi:hypothetical protein